MMKTKKHLVSTLLSALLLMGLAQESGAQRVVASGYSHGPRIHLGSRRVWVPGRYESVNERVWIPAYTERVWIEPRFGWGLDLCGRRVWVLQCAGHWQNVLRPGHYESRVARVYRPGYWAPLGTCRG